MHGCSNGASERSGWPAGALRCPRCAEDRLVERVGHQGFCAVCGFVWKPATGTDDDADDDA